MFQVFVLLVLPFWTSANSYNVDKNVQKQIEAFQNTVNEFKDLVHVQRQRNDRIELELLKSRNEMEQMKENYLNEIEKLNNRVSNLELIEAKYNRILTAMIEDSQEQMNLSDADLSMKKKKSEDGERDIYRIQKRVLTPSSTSRNGVAFYAYMTTRLHTPSTEHVLVFDVVKTNIGNAYHPSTGVFMVPESGVYVFTWTFWIGDGRDNSIQLMVNREDVGTVYLQTISGVESVATGIVVTHVNAGDDVFVRKHSAFQIGTGQYIQSNIYGRSSFAGWKIF